MAATSAAGPRPDFVFAGDGVLYVYFPDRIDRMVNRQVITLFRHLSAQAVAGIAELVPGYRSLMIAFDPLALSDDLLVAAVQRALAPADRPTGAQKLLTMPVAYGGEYGPDLPLVARHSGLTPQEVVRLHSAASYDVFCVGFTPGFPFLGGLPPQLATPRRAQPRLRVEAGSVAIAGSQAGIYPLPSPGGWQIIGRTPMALCDLRPDASAPVLLQPGDQVRFEAVDAEEFARLAVHEHSGVDDGA